MTEKRRGNSRLLLLLNVSRNVSKNTSIIVSINASILISILVFLFVSILISILTFILTIQLTIIPFSFFVITLSSFAHLASSAMRERRYGAKGERACKPNCKFFCRFIVS